LSRESEELLGSNLRSFESVKNRAPSTLLLAAMKDIERAKFVVQDDRPILKQMLAELDWAMKTALAQEELVAHEEDSRNHRRRLKHTYFTLALSYADIISGNKPEGSILGELPWLRMRCSV
jgi:hypothetical protein